MKKFFFILIIVFALTVTALYTLPFAVNCWDEGGQVAKGIFGLVCVK